MCESSFYVTFEESSMFKYEKRFFAFPMIITSTVVRQFRKELNILINFFVFSMINFFPLFSFFSFDLVVCINDDIEKTL